MKLPKKNSPEKANKKWDEIKQKQNKRGAWEKSNNTTNPFSLLTKKQPYFSSKFLNKPFNCAKKRSIFEIRVYNICWNMKYKLGMFPEGFKK